MPGLTCPACGLDDRIATVAQVLDAGSAHPTGNNGFFYGWITYEIDLVASRSIARDVARLRRDWMSIRSWRVRRTRRTAWKAAESRLRTLPFCVRDEAVVANGQTSTIVRSMERLLDESTSV